MPPRTPVDLTLALAGSPAPTRAYLRGVTGAKRLGEDVPFATDTKQWLVSKVNV